jgi:poly(hydroxyalkanoate) depolymerase family esterase
MDRARTHVHVSGWIVVAALSAWPFGAPAGTRAEPPAEPADTTALRYRIHVPAAHGTAGPLPLVVMLHGCTQDAADFAAGTRMDRIAEEAGFVVLYPEQDAATHPYRCWRWFDAAHQRRGAGEPARIAALVRSVVEEVDIDRRRIYVAGLSAGGAMSVVLAATYPDLFAAGASHSGLAYAAVEEEAAARDLLTGRVADVHASARRALAAMAEHARPVPFIVFHGADDPVVAPAHAEDLAAQWALTNRMAAGESPREPANALVAREPPDAPAPPPVPAPERSDGEAGGYGFVRYVYRDAADRPLVEAWLVDGLGHGWSGGDAAGTFTDPRGPDASREIVRFFLSRRNPDGSGS